MKFVDFQVTQVVHEPTIYVHVQNLKKIQLDNEQFVHKVTSITNDFGFLVFSISDYLTVDELQPEKYFLCIF